MDYTLVRPATEQKIEKHLIKTGVKEVDEELLLTSLCLTRIEKKHTQELEKKYEASGVQAVGGSAGDRHHYVQSSVGGIVDATGRSAMGSRPDELFHSRDAVLHRTDITVAMASIRRVASAATEALHGYDACRAEVEMLRKKCQMQEEQLSEQMKQLTFFRDQLAELSTPEAIYEAFKSVWEAAAVAGSANTLSHAKEMFENVSNLEKHKNSAVMLSKEAVVRQQILDDTASKTLAIVGEIDVDKIGEMFKLPDDDNAADNKRNGSMRSSPAVTSGPSSGRIDTALKITEMSGGNAIQPISAATDKILTEQARQCDYHVEQRVAKFTHNPITNAQQAAEAILDCDQPVQFSRQADSLHFVVRRLTADKGKRVVRMQGSSASIVGKLASVILYAPGDLIQLEVDMKSTLGRKQQLMMQAEELHLTDVWNELCLYSRPFLNVVHFKVTPSLELQLKKKDFDVRPLMIDDSAFGSGGVVEFEERRRQQEKRLAFKRLEASLKNGRGDENDYGENNNGLSSSSPSRASKHFLVSSTHPSGNPYAVNDNEHYEHNTQTPGIIRYIANKRGQAPVDDATGTHMWFDPLENGSMRVLASSVMRPAELSSIVKPFRDRHSNFFCTRDEPGQYVEISFEQMSILPTGYSLASTHPISASKFPRYWRFEGSVDRIKWSTLLRHVNDDSINRYAPTWTWTLPRDTQDSSFYSHFRIVNEGPNASGDDALCISSVEIYGKLIYITPEMTMTKMADATIPDERPQGFLPLPPLPIQKETKPAGKKAAKKK